MTDFNPENLLRRYRPAGPPADLGARISNAARLGESWNVREWLPAISAAAAAAFYTLASWARSDLPSQVDTAGNIRAAIVNELAQALGGDDSARKEAERVVMIEELQSQEADSRRPIEIEVAP